MSFQSISTISAAGPRETLAVAQYYARTSVREVNLSPEVVEAIAGYYAGPAGPGGDHHEAAGGSVWVGAGLAEVGLVEGEAVTVEQIQNLLEGLMPDTARADGAAVFADDASREAAILPRPARANTLSVQAYDFTVARTKEESVAMALAQLAAGSGDWEEAAAGAARLGTMTSIQDRAFAAARAAAEHDMAVYRSGKGGVAAYHGSGLISSLTVHDTARPVTDPVTGKSVVAPHSHDHWVIYNVIRAADGTFHSLSSKHIYEARRTFNAVYDQVARELYEAELGWHFDKEPGKPVFRLEGFDAALREKLSPRQRQILEHMVEMGLDQGDLAQRAATQKATREGKLGCGGDHSEMLSYVGSLGLTMAELDRRVERAAEARRAAELDRRMLEQMIGPLPADFAQARAWERTAALRLAGLIDDSGNPVVFGPGDERPEPATERAAAAAAVDVRSVEAKVSDALRELGHSNSHFTFRQMVAAVMDQGVGHREAELWVGRWVAQPDKVVRLGGIEADDGLLVDGMAVPIAGDHLMEARYCDAEVYGIEQRLAQGMREGRGRFQPILAGYDEFQQVIDALAAGPSHIVIEPGSDQWEVIEEMLLGDADRVCVSGQAGVGKTASMSALVTGATDIAAQIAAERGRSVLGASMSANAAVNLSAESGMVASSVTMLLSQLRGGKLTLPEGATIVIDEASQLGTVEAGQLDDYARRHGARIIYTGDARQLGSPAAGGAFAAMVDDPAARDQVLFLDTIRRQRDIAERAVLACLHDRGVLSERSRRALVAQAEQAVAAGRPEERDALEDILARLDAALEESKLSPRRAGEAPTSRDAIIDFYMRAGRVHARSSLTEVSADLAAAWWDAWQGGDRFGQLAVLAASNAEVERINLACREEGLRRGALDPASRFEFGGKEWYAGERVVARAVDRKGNPKEVLNGMVGCVEATAVIPTLWTVTVREPGSAHTFEVDLDKDPELKLGLFERVKPRAAARAAGGLLGRVGARGDFEVWRAAKKAADAVSKIPGLDVSAGPGPELARPDPQRSVEVWYSAERVADKQAKALSRLARAERAAATKAAWVATLEGRAQRDEATVREARRAADAAKAALQEARSHAMWASALPGEGGRVLLEAEQVVVSQEATCLMVRQDPDGDKPGELLPLREHYVARHLHLGNALTSQRGQGLTVNHGEATRLSYVDGTRGRLSNTIRPVVPALALIDATRAAEQARVDEIAAWLGSGMGDPSAAGAQLAALASRLREMPAEALADAAEVAAALNAADTAALAAIRTDMLAAARLRAAAELGQGGTDPVEFARGRLHGELREQRAALRAAHRSGDTAGALAAERAIADASAKLEAVRSPIPADAEEAAVRQAQLRDAQRAAKAADDTAEAKRLSAAAWRAGKDVRNGVSSEERQAAVAARDSIVVPMWEAELARRAPLAVTVSRLDAVLDERLGGEVAVALEAASVEDLAGLSDAALERARTRIGARLDGDGLAVEERAELAVHDAVLAAELSARANDRRAARPGEQVVADTIGGVRTVLAADAQTMRGYVAGDIVAAEVIASASAGSDSGRRVAVTRTKMMRDDLAEQVTDELVAHGGLLFDPWKVTVPAQAGAPTHERTLAVAMPVNVSTYTRRGLEAMTPGIVTGRNETGGAVVELADGSALSFSAAETANHVTPAWAVTEAAVLAGQVQADTLVVVASGAAGGDGIDLDRLAQVCEFQQAAFELVMAGPELSAERAADTAVREKLAEQFTADIAPASQTAHQVQEMLAQKALDELLVDAREARDRGDEELAARLAADAVRLRAAGLPGLPQLSAERREAAEALDRLAGPRSPEQLAEEAARARVAALEPAARQAAFEASLAAGRPDHPDLDKRAASLAEQLEQARARLALLSDDQVLLDPATEALRQAERAALVAAAGDEGHRLLTAAAERLERTERAMSQMVAAHAVEVAGMDVRPSYLPALRSDDGWEHPAVTVRDDREMILEVETYRARWGVTDPERPLGPPPHDGGLREKEWLEVARRCGLSEELARFEGIDPAVMSVEQLRESAAAQRAGFRAAGAAEEVCTFHREADGSWSVQGPADQLRAGEFVDVRRRDGSMTQVLVTEVGSRFRVGDGEFAGAAFEGWGGGDPPAQHPEHTQTLEPAQRAADEASRGAAEARGAAVAAAVERRRQLEQMRRRGVHLRRDEPGQQLLVR